MIEASEEVQVFGYFLGYRELVRYSIQDYKLVEMIHDQFPHEKYRFQTYCGIRRFLLSCLPVFLCYPTACLWTT